MIDRRSFLIGSALVTVTGWSARAAAAGARDQQLHAMLTRWFDDDVLDSPGFATFLQRDTGANSHLRSKLNDESAEKVARERALAVSRSRQLREFGPGGLSDEALLNYQIAEHVWATRALSAKFPYGEGPGWVSPYVVSQLGGSYYSVPGFLENQHPVSTRSDAEAFLARLAEFSRVLDEETDRIRQEAALGVVPPDFVLDKTLENLRKLRSTPASASSMVQSLAKRTKERGIAGPWESRAAQLLTGPVAAALDRQIGALQSLRPQAPSDPGVWRLPDGEDYYAYGLRFFTTTDMSPQEVHRLGLETVARLTRELDTALRKQGYTRGTVGQRLNALNREPRFLLPNTDQGREQYLALARQHIQKIEGRLPRAFNTIPKGKVEVRRTPPEIELGAPFATYNSGPPDGSRPATYYLNLRDMAEWPTHRLASLTHHEVMPGHHLQTAGAQQQDALPPYRKFNGFSAFSEGWAVYSEQVADELGIYADDPFGRIGHLRFYLFRAVRLVVDSGLNHMRWSRERAIRYMVETAAEPEGNAVREIERYGVWPGQASSYWVGRTIIAQLREEAERRHGGRFDLKHFHDLVLAAGPLPMEVLQRRVRRHLADREV